MFLDFASKHIIKGVIAHAERKQGKLTCKSYSFRRPRHKKTKIKTNQKT